ISPNASFLCPVGCGFIGRNLATYLLDNELAQEVRIADKTPPQMAWLNEEQSALFESDRLEFCSANLINAASCKAAFAPHPTTGRAWDIVINCAAETRANQDDAVYKEGILKLSLNCANEAAAQRVKRYVELSSGCMNSSEKTPLKEDCKLDPWTGVAKQKLKVEKELANMDDLSYTIIRLPVVYGIGDKRYLMPRIIIAAIYKHLNETMKLLWNDAMRLNTVHVSDVCAAIWQLAQSPKTASQVYNIVDDSASTQGSISNLLVDIFDINVDYFGIVMSNLTKLYPTDTVGEINDKHMGPWAEICQRSGIDNTPLTPYLDEEQLHHKHLYLDNTKLKDFGYVLQHPKVTRELLMEMINDYVKQQLFPKSLTL
ncbi:hypothetical protein KR067_002021, partial [Drosophila pandora]